MAIERKVRRVKFLKLISTERYDDEGYSSYGHIIGDAVSEWLDVPEENFYKIYSELARQFNRTPAYGSKGVNIKLIVIEDPMITNEDLQVTLAKIKETERKLKQAEEDKKKKADERKVQKEVSKIKDKKAMLEKLKKELGEV